MKVLGVIFVLFFSLPALGRRHTCASDSGGGLYCWGNNDQGNLGTGDATQRLLPTLVAPQSNEAAASTTHTCARLNGVGHCWGNNDYGQYLRRVLAERRASG